MKIAIKSITSNMKTSVKSIITTGALVLSICVVASSYAQSASHADAKFPAAATNDSNVPGVTNIVLVHGAFADGSSWSKVIKILQAKGYNATAVQNPLTSFADDVAATRRALALQNGPVILVGHSWAGVVITEAGMETNVVGLVYVGAFGPGGGGTAVAIGQRY